MDDDERLLYRCPPLSAWITMRQCGTNASLAKRAVESSPGALPYTDGLHVRDTCPGCPGVRKLGAGVREFPETASAPLRPKRRRRSSFWVGSGTRPRFGQTVYVEKLQQRRRKAKR